MRMNSDDLRFSPQIAALAMPTESEFSKAAEGISNVGKVFQDQQDREQTQKLNALNMDVKQQELIGKQNENSVFGEKSAREAENHLLTKRNSQLDILKKETEQKSAYQKAMDDESTKKLASWTPKEAYMNAQGQPDRSVIANTKAALLESPEWMDKGHIVHAWFDTLEGNIFKGAKEKAEVDDKISTTNKRNLEATTVIPESKAKIWKDMQSGAASGASAQKTNMEIKQMPQELAMKQGNLDVAKTNATTQKSQEKRLSDKQLSDTLALADDEFKNYYPDFGTLTDEAEKLEYRDILHRTKGVRKPIIEDGHIKRMVQNPVTPVVKTHVVEQKGRPNPSQFGF